MPNSAFQKWIFRFVHFMQAEFFVHFRGLWAPCLVLRLYLRPPPSPFPCHWCVRFSPFLIAVSRSPCLSLYLWLCMYCRCTEAWVCVEETFFFLLRSARAQFHKLEWITKKSMPSHFSFIYDALQALAPKHFASYHICFIYTFFRFLIKKNQQPTVV